MGAGGSEIDMVAHLNDGRFGSRLVAPRVNLVEFTTRSVQEAGKAGRKQSLVGKYINASFWWRFEVVPLTPLQNGGFSEAIWGIAALDRTHSALPQRVFGTSLGGSTSPIAAGSIIEDRAPDPPTLEQKEADFSFGDKN